MSICLEGTRTDLKGFSPLFLSQEAPLPGQNRQGGGSDWPYLMLLSLENQPDWAVEVSFQVQGVPLTFTLGAKESVEETDRVLGLEEDCFVQV